MQRLLLPSVRAAGLVLLMGACASVAYAAPATTPFRATLSIREQVVPIGDTSCAFFGLIKGTGSSSLGDVALTSVDCINPMPPTNKFFAFASDVFVLHTVNGDLFVAYSGRLSPQGVITGKYVILGGTGELQGATGSGTLHGFETIDQQAGTGTGQIDLEGTFGF